MTNIAVMSSMRFAYCTLLIIILIACKNTNNRPDVSNIRVNVKLERFDRDFFAMDTNNLDASLNALHKKYPAFLPLYSEYLSPINLMVQQQGKSYEEAVKIFYRAIKPLAEEVQKKYGNLEQARTGFEKSFRYVKHYYPSFTVPQVVASVENFNPDNPQEVYGAILYQDTLILSLQMFMGKDFEQYDNTLYPQYLKRRFTGEYIVPNGIGAVVKGIYPDTSQSASLIEQMIERGKQWLLLDRFLPDTPDSLKTGYTKSQTEFIEKNEGNIWGEFLKSTPDPYTLDQERLKNFLGEAPFTPDMPHDLDGNGTPGNIGQWLGWRIVQKFASENPELTLQQILATPARKIFQLAKYKPK